MAKVSDMTQTEFFAQINSTIVTTIDAKLAPLANDMSNMKSQLDQHSGELAELRANCAEALQVAKNSGSAAAAARPKFKARVEGQGWGSGGGEVPFVASYVVIKGFADFQTRKISGIDRPEAEKLLGALEKSVPETTKLRMQMKDMKVVGGGKSDSIQIPVEPGYADEIQGDLQASLNSLGYTFNGMSIWVQVERPPWIQKRYSAFGRIRAFLDEQLSTVHSEMTVSCTWQPEFVILVDSGHGVEREAGHIDENGDCHLEEDWCQDVLGVPACDLKSRLRTFRSSRRR